MSKSKNTKNTVKDNGPKKEVAGDQGLSPYAVESLPGSGCLVDRSDVEMDSLDLYIDGRDTVDPRVVELLIAREERLARSRSEVSKARLEIEYDHKRKKLEYDRHLASIERREANEMHKKDYQAAMVRMRNSMPAIVTNNTVTRQENGEEESYLYPSYNEVIGHVSKWGSKHGFAYDVDTRDIPGRRGEHIVEVVIDIYHMDSGYTKRVVENTLIEPNKKESLENCRKRHVSYTVKGVLVRTFALHYEAGKEVAKNTKTLDSDTYSDTDGKEKAKDEDKTVVDEDCRDEKGKVPVIGVGDDVDVIKSGQVVKLERGLARTDITVSNFMAELKMKSEGRKVGTKLEDIPADLFGKALQLLAQHDTAKDKLDGKAKGKE